MAVQLKILVQNKYEATEEFRTVNEVAQRLHQHLCEPQVLTLLAEANQPGSSSSAVQNVFLEKALALGFVSEKKGLFGKYATSGLRPDYYLEIGKVGVLLEVERGKTIMNNMDLLDLWKCHICAEANYLFLMVPLQLKHNKDAKPYNTFNMVVNRMSPFFEQENHTNVRALFIFGY